MNYEIDTKMKKLFVFLLLLFLFSCEKEPHHCWKCETRLGEEILTQETICYFTYSEMIEYRNSIIQKELSHTECTLIP